MSMAQKATSWLIKKLHICSEFIKTYRIEAIASIVSVSIAIGGAGMGHAYFQSNVNTIYHVYLHDKKIGTVDDPQLIDTWIADKIEYESNKFEDITLEDNLNGVTFEEEEGFKPEFDNLAAIEALDSEFFLVAQAKKLVINDEFIGFIADEDMLNNILNDIKSEYVSDEFLSILKMKQNDPKNFVAIASANEPVLDEETMVEATFKQDIVVENATVHPSQVINEEILIDKLIQTKEEQKVHRVQSGDVLGTIASQYGLSLNELLAINPSLSENSLIQIGQEIIVVGEEPFLTVVTVENLRKKETIKFEVETKLDPNMYRGNSRVEQEGREGEKLVDYMITRENGNIIKREVTDEVIIREPQTRIVIRGDKINPSRGTGQFQWPAVGGRISSGYGMRWGRLHSGIDIAGVSNRTIKAADHGTVTTAGWHNSYGRYVIINHSNGYETLYAHLSSISVSRGQVVRQGQSIGIMGSTGNSTGIHLHFEVIKNGRTVNPLPYIRR